MATETLYADAHITGAFSNPANAVGNTPTTWAGVVNTNSSPTSRWSITDTVDPLTTAATHTVNVVARKGSNAGTPTMAVNLYDNGVLVKTLVAATNITSTTGQTLTGTFNTTEVSSAANVEVQLVVVGVGGNPSTRNSAQASHIEVVFDTTAPSTDRTAEISFSEFEIADAPRRAEVSWSELEVPDEPGPINLVQTATDDNGGVDTTSVTITFGTTPVQGNLMVAVLTTSSARPFTLPTGWNLAISSDDRTQLFYRVAGAAEPTGHTFTFASGTAVRTNGHLHEWAGLHDVQAEVLHQTGSFLNEVAGTHIETGDTPTTAYADALAIGALSPNGNRTFSGITDSFTLQTTLPRSITTSRILTATGIYGHDAVLDTDATIKTGVIAVFRPLAPPTDDRRAEVSFSEFEVASAPRRAEISWSEIETPDAARRTRVSFTETEIPDGARRPRISFAEAEAPDAPRRSRVSFAEAEAPDAPRRSRVSFAEAETPDAARRTRVSFAEGELPDAARGVQVSFAEAEAPDAPRRSRVSFAEAEAPDAPRRAFVSFAEAETPDAARRSRVSFAEGELPTAPRRSRVSFAEAETPDAARQARVSFTEMEIGAALADNAALVSFTEMEIGPIPRRARISFTELEQPIAPRRAFVSFAEGELPDAARGARVSFAEGEVPDAARGARVSFTEYEIVDAPRRALVSFAETEHPIAPRRAFVSFAEGELPNAPRIAQISWAEMETDLLARRARVSWAQFDNPVESVGGRGSRRNLLLRVG